MTLNDSERPFYVKYFHYYDLSLSKYLLGYIFTDQRPSAGSRLGCSNRTVPSTRV